MKTFRFDRTTALILAITLMLSFAAGVAPAMAAEAGEEIPLTNPGFDADTDMTGWMHIQSDEQISLETDDVHSPPYALKIENTQNNYPYVCQSVQGLEPGTIYELRAWVKSTVDSGAGVKIEQYTETGVAVGENVVRFSGTNDGWRLCSARFQAMEEVTKVRIFMRSYAVGTALFDDVSLWVHEVPLPYELHTDKVFYYADEETGTASVEGCFWADAESPALTDATVDFSLCNGDTVLVTENNALFTEKTAQFTYPISAMAKKQTAYTIKAVVKSKTSGETIGELTKNVYVFDRPRNIAADGIYRIDGEPFYPVIAYHAAEKSYDVVRGAGFNVVQVATTANAERLGNSLDALWNYGLQGLVCLYPNALPAGHPDNIENTRQLVERFKDHPAVFGWVTMDEPTSSGMTEEMKRWLEASYLAVRGIDSVHPVIITDYTNLEEFTKYCDACIADIYVHTEPVDAVSETLEPFMQSQSHVPVYTMAATFQSRGVFPTSKVIRSSIYRGLAAGATGVGYYSIDDAIRDVETIPLYETAVWTDIVKLNTEELPILLACYGDPSADAYNAGREGTAYKEMLWETWILDGQMYLLAHNRSESTQTITIPLSDAAETNSIGKYVATPVGMTAAGEKTGEGSLELTLHPEEAALYAIDKIEVSVSQDEDLSVEDEKGSLTLTDIILGIIREILENIAVNNFSDTDVSSATGDDEAKVNIHLKGAKFRNENEEQVVKSMTFDVKPVDKNGNTIENDKVKAPITFRLPVDKRAKETKAKLLHNGSPMYGYYDVRTEKGEKYIEVSTTKFGTFSYDLVDAATLKPTWTTGTDAGYYLSGTDKLGLMRFLFHAAVSGTIEESGIKYIKGSNIEEPVESELADGGKGRAATFYGDIVDIPQTTTGTYYAMAYVVVDGETYWSDALPCSPNFTKYFSNLNKIGGVE